MSTTAAGNAREDDSREDDARDGDTREPAVLRCGALAVRFHRSADRFRHTVELVLDGQVTPLLESIEGSPEENWPPSPPLTQLELESRKPPRPNPLPKGEGVGDGALPFDAAHGGPDAAHGRPEAVGSTALTVGEGASSRTIVALLVGMAGSSHWSLGVESDSSEGAGGPRFDVACRLRALAGRLASSYRTLVPARLDQQSGVVLLEAGGVVCKVQGNRVAPGATRMELTGSALTIRPAPCAGEVPTTMRWAYVVSLVN